MTATDHIRAGRSARLGVLGSIALVAALSFAMPSADARRPADRHESVDVVHASQLPREGREVLGLIRAGGPFPYPRDGIRFGNREGLLPKRGAGYYAEYTVPTPGERTRGARRIIAGLGATGDFRSSNEYYYTNDHYQTFRRIVQ